MIFIKKQVLTLIIGMLIGAILSTCVLLFLKGNSRSNRDFQQNFENFNVSERGFPNSEEGESRRPKMEENSEEE